MCVIITKHIQMQIINERPVVIYNSEKQEVIGIFKTPLLAGRYLFPANETNHFKSQNILKAANRSGKISNSKFQFDVAVRYAKDNHIELLQDNFFVILPGYSQPEKSQMKGFIKPTKIQY